MQLLVGGKFVCVLSVYCDIPHFNSADILDLKFGEPRSLKINHSFVSVNIYNIFYIVATLILD